MTFEDFQTTALFIQDNVYIFILVLLWSLIWKGFALWYAARLSHKYWFMALLVLNTVGLLEVIYLFLVANNYKIESVEEKSSAEKNK